MFVDWLGKGHGKQPENQVANIGILMYIGNQFL